MSALLQHKSWDHKISLISEISPKIGPIYILFHTQLKILKNYLDENLKKSFIQKAKTTVEFSILFIPKKDGKLRLCVNYRKLNTIMIKDKYLLPNIRKFQNHLIGAKWFIKLDLREAYNLIRIKKSNKWKTVFRTQYKIYKYQIILFGLINAPVTCQTLINNTLAEYLDIYVVIYLDNILIYSENLKDYQRHVENVLERFLAKQLRYRSEKYEFHKKEVDFLGFVVRIDRIKIDLEKIQRILDWPEPKNLKNLQRFLGFGNFNRQFINGYSLIILSLMELTKKNILFIWTTLCQETFDRFKKTFITVSYLILFISDKPVRIEIDTSDKSIEVCLL